MAADDESRGGPGKGAKGKGKSSGPPLPLRIQAPPRTAALAQPREHAGVQSMAEALASRRAAADVHTSSNTDLPPSRIFEIADGHTLWLGNYLDAENREALVAANVTTILNCAKDVAVPAHGTSGEFVYMKFDIDDVPVAADNLRDHLDSAVSFIDDGLRRGNVLVHCRLGRSRSASMVMAYLMAKQGWTYDAALQHLKEKRRLYKGALVEPNEGFKLVLQEFWQGLQQKVAQATNLL